MLRISFESCFHILRPHVSEAEDSHSFSLHLWNGSDSGREREQFSQKMGVLFLKGARDTGQTKEIALQQ